MGCEETVQVAHESRVVAVGEKVTALLEQGLLVFFCA